MDHPDTPLQHRLALLTDRDLRLRASTLVEQCEREATLPPENCGGVSRQPYLTITEIYTLLGLSGR